jgi:hypothetical protein
MLYVCDTFLTSIVFVARLCLLLDQMVTRDFKLTKLSLELSKIDQIVTRNISNSNSDKNVNSNNINNYLYSIFILSCSSFGNYQKHYFEGLRFELRILHFSTLNVCSVGLAIVQPDKNKIKLIVEFVLKYC